MTYQDMADNFHSQDLRPRMEMCIREQAHLTFANSEDAANASLADSVIGGDMAAIDALMAAISVGPNGAALADDPALLSAVQAAWPVTASAFYNLVE